MPSLVLPAVLPTPVTTPVVPSVVPTYTALIGGAYYAIEATTLNIQNQVGQRSQGSVTVMSPLGVYWLRGTQFLLFDETGAQVYGGYVANDHGYRDNGVRQADLGWMYHDLTLMDNCYRADKRVPFKIYLNVTAGYIVNDLYGAYLAAEGVTITAGSVASGATIQMVVWNGSKTIADALTWLAQKSGYWWNIDATGVLWFQPYGGIPAPFAVDGTNVDSMQQVSVDYGNDLQVNKQYAKGGVAQKGSTASPLVESFKGDGARRAFTLAYPVNTIISVTLNAVDITSTVQDKGTSGGHYYTLVADPVVAQDPSQTVLTSSDTLTVTYIGQYPVITVAQNSAAIAAQAIREGNGSGIIESVYSDSKLRTLPAAFQEASSQLAHYGADIVILTCTTKTKGLAPGQLLPVSLSDYGLAAQSMLIAGVTVSDQVDGLNIWYTVQAIGAIGATSWALETAQWQTFWQRVMAQSSDPSDYTDANDTALTPINASVATTTPTITITESKALCSLFSSGSLFGATTFC